MLPQYGAQNRSGSAPLSAGYYRAAPPYPGGGGGYFDSDYSSSRPRVEPTTTGRSNTVAFSSLDTSDMSSNALVKALIETDDVAQLLAKVNLDHQRRLDYLAHSDPSSTSQHYRSASSGAALGFGLRSPSLYDDEADPYTFQPQGNRSVSGGRRLISPAAEPTANLKRPSPRTSPRKSSPKKNRDGGAAAAPQVAAVGSASTPQKSATKAAKAEKPKPLDSREQLKALKQYRQNWERLKHTQSDTTLHNNSAYTVSSVGNNDTSMDGAHHKPSSVFQSFFTKEPFGYRVPEDAAEDDLEGFDRGSSAGTEADEGDAVHPHSAAAAAAHHSTTGGQRGGGAAAAGGGSPIKQQVPEKTSSPKGFQRDPMSRTTLPGTVEVELPEFYSTKNFTETRNYGEGGDYFFDGLSAGDSRRTSGQEGDGTLPPPRTAEGGAPPPPTGAKLAPATTTTTTTSATAAEGQGTPPAVPLVAPAPVPVITESPKAAQGNKSKARTATPQEVQPLGATRRDSSVSAAATKENAARSKTPVATTPASPPGNPPGGKKAPAPNAAAQKPTTKAQQPSGAPTTLATAAQKPPASAGSKDKEKSSKHHHHHYRHEAEPQPAPRAQPQRPTSPDNASPRSATETYDYTYVSEGSEDEEYTESDYTTSTESDEATATPPRRGGGAQGSRAQQQQAGGTVRFVGDFGEFEQGDAFYSSPQQRGGGGGGGSNVRPMLQSQNRGVPLGGSLNQPQPQQSQSFFAGRQMMMAARQQQQQPGFTRNMSATFKAAPDGSPERATVPMPTPRQVAAYVYRPPPMGVQAPPPPPTHRPSVGMYQPQYQQQGAPQPMMMMPPGMQRQGQGMPAAPQPQRGPSTALLESHPSFFQHHPQFQPQPQPQQQQQQQQFQPQQQQPRMMQPQFGQQQGQRFAPGVQPFIPMPLGVQGGQATHQPLLGSRPNTVHPLNSSVLHANPYPAMTTLGPELQRGGVDSVPGTTSQRTQGQEAAQEGAADPSSAAGGGHQPRFHPHLKRKPAKAIPPGLMPQRRQ